jgi:hypothetical protein
MNIRCLLTVFLFAAAAGCTQAQTTSAPAPRTMTIVVSESLNRGAEGISTFAAIQKVFTSVLEKRLYPIKVNVERFASNNPDYPCELEVFFKGFYSETPGDLTLRAWVTLYDQGKEHDFGILKYQLYPAPLLHREDQFEGALRGEAEIVATKLTPILFLKSGGHNP